MLKGFALVFAATAVLAIPTTDAFAAPKTTADGLLPAEACHAVYPQPAQAVLCGRGKGGPGAG
jgi:hypothetical protein